MTYSDLYTTVTQYNTNLQRSSPTCRSAFYKILARFWKNPYAKPNN
jgi:hypothetical protein